MRARKDSLSHSETSLMLGTVADTATNRVEVPRVFIRETTTSWTAPRTSAPTEWTSSTLSYQLSGSQ